MKNRNEIIIILLAAIGVGIVTGISASLFNSVVIFGVGIVKKLIFEYKVGFILLPLLAAGVTALMYQTVLKNNMTGIGITQVLLELKTPDTYFLKPRSVFWHVIATIVTLVMGLTAGRFGPITHLGASIGSKISDFLNLNDEHMKLMIGCGAAGAIATVFSLPFFAALFVMEVLFRERKFKLLSPLLISSMVSNLIGIKLLGNHVPISVPMYLRVNLESYIWVYIGLGISVGVISALYVESIERIGIAMQSIKGRLPGVLFASLMVGICAYFIPEQFEIHLNTTNLILNEQMAFTLLLALIFLRILLTAVTLGAGFIGGNFYPGVTIGAAVGVLYWRILDYTGFMGPSQSEMGILGICGMAAGFLHAPLACIVLAVELSNSSTLIMPAMLVTATAVTVSYMCSGYDIFSRPLGRLLTWVHRQEAHENN